MLFQKNERLVMIGDSITDCGRSASGEGEPEGTGRGYVAQVEALLHSVYPELSIHVINKGTSGHTVRDLQARWQGDVLDLKPDWLSIMIGTNDVWRQFDNPHNPKLHVYPEEFERTLRGLVERTLPRVRGLVLMTPFYLEPDRAEPMRAKMDLYGQIVKTIATGYATTFVDTQAAFDDLFKHVHTSTLAGDRVHPYQRGHMVITHAFLDAIGFHWQHNATNE
jgi:lysophospholipase L1-like esterase